jgi:hypothetical protein
MNKQERINYLLQHAQIYEPNPKYPVWINIVGASNRIFKDNMRYRGDTA